MLSSYQLNCQKKLGQWRSSPISDLTHCPDYRVKLWCVVKNRRNTTTAKEVERSKKAAEREQPRNLDHSVTRSRTTVTPDTTNSPSRLLAYSCKPLLVLDFAKNKIIAQRAFESLKVKCTSFILYGNRSFVCYKICK